MYTYTLVNIWKLNGMLIYARASLLQPILHRILFCILYPYFSKFLNSQTNQCIPPIFQVDVFASSEELKSHSLEKYNTISPSHLFSDLLRK